MEESDVMTYDPGSHTIDEVNEYLAQHPEETDAVLAAEQARGDDARSTLVNQLQRQNGQPEPGQQTEGEPSEDLDAGYPTGEYPTEGIFGYVTEDTPVE